LYGENVESNLLKNLTGESGALPIILELIFLVIAVVHIPIIFYVGKEAVLIMFDEATRKSYSNPPEFKNKHPLIEMMNSSYSSNPSITPHEAIDRVIDEIDENGEGGESEQAEQPEVVPKLAEGAPNPHDSKVAPEPKEEENIPGSEKVEVVPEPEPEHVDVVPAPEPVIIVNPKEYLNMKNIYYYIVAITCFVVVLLLSILVSNVSVFFGLIGSFAGCFNVMAGPSTFYIFAIHKYKVVLFNWKDKLSYILGILIMIVGYIGMISLAICVVINAAT
jgi:hypothetical protein